MSPSTADPAPDAATEEEHCMLADYGIARVPADVFHWGGYRYSSFKDALAAARRAERAAASNPTSEDSI
ncbi:hypothetical protein ACX40Y_17240 [Sphingomonas sp. RS6]